MILPGDSELLSGAISLEDMDVLVHPLRLELMVIPLIYNSVTRIRPLAMVIK